MSPANKAYFMSYTKEELVNYIERLLDDMQRRKKNDGT